jgi:predicted nucleic acid-binding protein
MARDWLLNQSWPIEPVSLADEEKAKDIIRRYTDKTFSYTDATSFAVMERLGAREAFAFDPHFQQYGLKLST